MKTAGVGLTIQSRPTLTGRRSSCCIYQSCISIAYQSGMICYSLPKYQISNCLYFLIQSSLGQRGSTTKR